MAYAADSRKLLAERVVQAAYLDGDFTLRSGQRSRYYFDKYRFESDPLLLRDLAAAMVDLLPADTQVIAGLELGGVPLATAMSLRAGLPACFVRKEAKPYGTRLLAEGCSLDRRKVTVVEDVLTTGGQVIRSVEQLRGEGAQIAHVVCALLRAEPARARLAEASLSLSAALEPDDVQPFITRAEAER